MPIKAKSTFKADDVTLLLTDITGILKPKPAEEREKLIQSGIHYSRMLPLEYKPSKDYLMQYYHALDLFAKETAKAVITLSEKIYLKKGKKAVLVSLARAGTPIGVLVKRYLNRKYNISVSHYTVSIVRGQGIDSAAIQYILNIHSAKDIQFIDGWTGKGAILEELYTATKELLGSQDKRTLLAVLADPANITDTCGTHEDIPIAGSFLNSTVCGLMSRTAIRPGIGADEFHGVAFYEELREEDRTYEFIERIENCCIEVLGSSYGIQGTDEIYDTGEVCGIDEVYEIAKKFAVADINFIKPGISEATRVLLRRVPDMLLIAEGIEPKYTAHLIQLAQEKNVPVVYYPLRRYRACGIIKALTPDL